MNTDGALICGSTAAGVWVSWLGTLDSGSRSVEWRELPLSNSAWWLPAWSPDSSRIAYASQDVVRLHDLASGEDREVYRHTGRLVCAWPENAKLICTNLSAQPPIEVFSVSLDSGRVESLGSLSGSLGAPFSAGDGGPAIYMTRQPDEELIRWDVATRQGTTVDRLTGFYDRGGNPIPFPSAHWLGRRNKETIEIRPAAGGEWRPLVSLPTGAMAFTPDGNWLLFYDVDAADKGSLFRISTSGGQRERIGDFPNVGPRVHSSLYVSPDGRKLLLESHIGQQVWILENFEPKQPAGR